MVVRTQKGQILEAGNASVQPVLDVVAVQEAVVGAAGEGTAAVAQDEGTPNRGWNRARAPANGHVCSSLVVADGHDAAITGHTAKRFRGKRCSIVQGAGQNAVRRQGILIDVKHDLEALATASAAHVACQVALGQGDDAVSTRRPMGITFVFAVTLPPFRGNVRLRGFMTDFASPVECGQDEIGFIGRQDDFELDHPAGQFAPAHRALGWREQIVRCHGDAVAAAQAFELGAGRVHGGVEQLGFGLGGGHAGEGTHLGIRKLSRLQGGVDGG